MVKALNRIVIETVTSKHGVPIVLPSRGEIEGNVAELRNVEGGENAAELWLQKVEERRAKVAHLIIRTEYSYREITERDRVNAREKATVMTPCGPKIHMEKMQGLLAAKAIGMTYEEFGALSPSVAKAIMLEVALRIRDEQNQYRSN
ncbi:hypothetical protein EON81_13745 [bacterium]|nr:MAG: hypothetical protein EON81_13745 [bacterium]